MKPAVQDSERRVVVAGDHDQLLVRADAHVAPDKQPVLGDLRRGDVARQTSERLPHAFWWLEMAVPVLAACFARILLAHRIDARLHPTEWLLVQRRLAFRHAPLEIDDPLAGWPTGQVHTVHPRLQDIGIRPPVRVGRQAEPLARWSPGTSKGPPFVSPLKATPAFAVSVWRRVRSVPPLSRRAVRSA